MSRCGTWKWSRHAAVACYEDNHGKQVNTFFPDALIRETVQEVGPREAVFLGRVMLFTQLMSKSADKAQMWYLSIIDPALCHAGAWGQVFRRSRADVWCSAPASDSRYTHPRPVRSAIDGSRRWPIGFMCPVGSSPDTFVFGRIGTWPSTC